MQWSIESKIRVVKIALILIFTLFIVYLTAFNYCPKYVRYSFLVFPLFFYLLIRFSIHKKNQKPEEYFLYERDMPVKQFIPSYVTTNIGLFSSIGYSVILCCYYGFQGMLWTTIAWFLGMYWFSKKVEYLLPFMKNGNTLHEYIAIKYGTTPKQMNKIRGYTSIITFILYICSIGIEIKFSGDVLSPIFGLNESLIIALLVSIVGVYCTYLSGYKGVVLTERFQYWIMIIMAIIIVLFSGWNFINFHNINLTHTFWVGNKQKSFDVSAMCSLLLVYQFCVMDMWQRCIAIACENKNTNKSDADIIKDLKNNTFKKALLPFLLFFIAFFLIGLVCIDRGINLVDTSKYLPAFLNLFNENNLIQLLAQSLIIVGFTAAAVSTVDSFLIAAVQTFMYDIYGNLYKKGLSNKIHTLETNKQYRFTNIARAFVIFFGLCAITLALFSFEFIQFWTSMYSIMLGFFPAVYFTLTKKKYAFKVKYVFLSIILGSGSALLLGFLGTFIYKSNTLTDIAPFLALFISTLFMLIAKTKSPS